MLIRHLLTMGLTLSLAGTAAAGTLSGKVQDDAGNVIPGAMITVTDDTRGLGESTFSDHKGVFNLTTELVSGQLALRVRKPYFADHKPL